MGRAQGTRTLNDALAGMWEESLTLLLVRGGVRTFDPLLLAVRARPAVTVRPGRPAAKPILAATNRGWTSSNERMEEGGVALDGERAYHASQAVLF